MAELNKVERYEWLPLSDGPQLRTVPVSRLKVDHAYQRTEVFERAVLKIAREFSWSKFGALSVADRDGELFITDGQQRFTAVKRRGDIDRVPCVVTKSDGVQSEAMAFIGINTNRNFVRAYAKYRAALTAGDPLHSMVQAMLDARGLKVNNEVGPQYVAFPALLLKTAIADAGHCERCLDLQREAIGPDRPLHNYVHKGLFHIATHQTHGDVYAHGAALFRLGGLPTMLNAIRAAAIESGNAAVSERLCAVGILAVVNRSLKRNKVTL
jgi:hypothetical protein